MSKKAVMILASTGTGKTFVAGAILRRLLDRNFAEGKTWGHVQFIYVTRSTVVEQTKRVFHNYFGINTATEVEVINIEQLRSRAGEMWVNRKLTIENGEEVEKWEWKKLINPCVLMLDECQAVKNETSTQHKILCAYSAIETPTTQFFISATPFTRVSEAKAFAIATRKDISHLGFPSGTRLTAATWQTYAAAIANPSPPDEYNEAAVERLMKDLDDYVVRVKGVRWQFNAINQVEIIDFDPPSESNDFTATQKEYQDAWETYVTRCAKLDQSVVEGNMQRMVEQGIYLGAAEYSKRYIFPKRMVQDVKDGYAAVLAVSRKRTLIGVVKILIEKYGVTRDQISLIWGGGQTQLTAKQKLKLKVRENESVFTEAGITMADMQLEEVEDRILEDLPPEYKLGMQSKEERQREIDKFQSGRSLYCIYTCKAGGVGLSLHHTDELTKYKVRRQKNGYAMVEDIKNVPTRPRKATVGPVWSPIELVQCIGRAPRLTSLSDTKQTLLYYRDTVEADQAFVVRHRLGCLSKVVKQKEPWTDLITNHARAKEISERIIEEMGPASDDKNGESTIGIDEGDDE
jgi:hypothetical protein